MTTSRTVYAREYARRKRRQRWLQEAESATRCPAMLARRTPCRAPLQSRFVDSVTVPYCPRCEKKRAGVCTEDGCTSPVEGTVGKAIRCALHRKLARAEWSAVWRRKAKNLRKRKARDYARDRSEDRKAYKRLWRAARPSKVRAMKRADYERNREKYLAYHRAYREARRAERAARERARAAGTLEARTCVTCDTVLSGRAKKCEACKQAARRAARAAIEARLERAA